MLKTITLSKLGEFLTECVSLFAPKTQVENNDINIETYVLNIDYENTLAFNTSQIVSGDGTSAQLDVGLLDMIILE